jgi:hypothetical protein
VLAVTTQEGEEEGHPAFMNMDMTDLTKYIHFSHAKRKLPELDLVGERPMGTNECHYERGFSAQMENVEFEVEMMGADLDCMANWKIPNYKLLKKFMGGDNDDKEDGGEKK